MKRGIIIIGAVLLVMAVLGVLLYNYSKPCVPDWECVDWNTCVRSVQARDCSDDNKCGDLEGRPEVVRSCNMLCFDRIQNQNEENIDCGGVCESCDIKFAPANKSKFIIYTSLIILCSVFIITAVIKGTTILKGKEAVTDQRLQQLQVYIKRCLASGYSSQAIKQILINSNWSEKMVDKALEDVTNAYLTKFYNPPKLVRR